MSLVWAQVWLPTRGYHNFRQDGAYNTRKHRIKQMCRTNRRIRICYCSFHVKFRWTRRHILINMAYYIQIHHNYEITHQYKLQVSYRHWWTTWPWPTRAQFIIISVMSLSMLMGHQFCDRCMPMWRTITFVLVCNNLLYWCCVAFITKKPGSLCQKLPGFLVINATHHRKLKYSIQEKGDGTLHSHTSVTQMVSH